MFGNARRIARLEKELQDLFTKVNQYEDHLRKLAEGVREQNMKAGKMLLPVMDEDGEPVMTYRLTPREKRNWISMSEVVKAIASHIGLTLSIEERDPERLRIEEEVVVVELQIGDDDGDV